MDILVSLTQQLALLDNAHEDLGLESHFTASHGMLAILEILEEKLSRDVAVRLLKIVNIVSPSSINDPSIKLMDRWSWVTLMLSRHFVSSEVSLSSS